MPPTPEPATPPIQVGWSGLMIALVVMSAWAVNLTVLLSTRPEDLGLWTPVSVALQVYLSTGLFITAHDAIHGSVAPIPWVNRAVGWVCTVAFAMFSYERLRRAHLAHHAHPASPNDPDYHDGKHTGAARWFATFMSRYLTRWHFIVWVPLGWGVLWVIFGCHPLSLLFFWPAPAVLSAAQLFYFGTYLPHREPAGGHTHPDRATSLRLGPGLSMLACYHFGYHREHHEMPWLPWWRLAAARHPPQP